MDREVRMQFLRPGQIVAEKERRSIIFLPLGPLEWHAPHLPFGTDPLNAQEAALRVAHKVGGVVLPTLFLGTERERSSKMLKSIGFKGDEYIVGMDFPKNTISSFYVPEEILAVTVRSYLDIMVKQKYKLIVLMNGHGAENQVKTLQRLAIEYTNTTGSKVLFLMSLPGFTTNSNSWSHATRGETSIMQAIAPDSVDLSQLPADGHLKNTDFASVDDLTFKGHPIEDFTVRPEEDPRKSTAEEGEKLIEQTIDELANVIKDELKKL